MRGLLTFSIKVDFVPHLIHHISTIKLTCFISDAFLWKHLPWPHNTCMTKKGGRWAHKGILTPPLFMGVSCTKPGRWAVMYLFARGISFYDFSIECLEMFRQCGIFCFFILIHFITILAAVCHVCYLYINMSCKGQVGFTKSVIKIKTNITVSSILWWTYFKCVKTVVCEERERELKQLNRL